MQFNKAKDIHNKNTLSTSFEQHTSSTSNNNATNTNTNTTANKLIISTSDYIDRYKAFKILLDGTRSIQKQFFPSGSTSNNMYTSTTTMNNNHTTTMHTNDGYIYNNYIPDHHIQSTTSYSPNNKEHIHNHSFHSQSNYSYHSQIIPTSSITTTNTTNTATTTTNAIQGIIGTNRRRSSTTYSYNTQHIYGASAMNKNCSGLSGIS